MSLARMFRLFALGSAFTLWPGLASADPSHCPKLASSADTVAQLDRVAPGVQVTRAGQSVPAAPCMPLRRGDIVETGHSSPALIQFAEGLVLLMPNTRAQIGSIWSYFGEVFSFGHVKLQDRYVTAGAEGTAYLFRSDADGTTVTVLQGHVRVTPKQPQVPGQRLAAGQRLGLSPSAVPTLTRLTPGEVAKMLRSYQALTGYSVEELALLERAFTQSTEVLQNTPPPPESASTPKNGDAPSASQPDSTPSSASPPSAGAGAEAGAGAGASGLTSTGKAAAKELGTGRSRDTASALLQGSFSFGGGGAPIEIGAGSLAFAWSHRFVRLGPLLLGSRVLGGAAFGRYRSPMTDPETKGREEAASNGTARLPFHGAFGKLDAELASNAPVLSLVGSLGLRAGWSHQRDVQSGADHLVWGPAASVRSEYAFIPGYRFLLELEVWAQRTPVFACSIGCNEPAEPRPAMWQAWIGLALGVGVDL
jgi:hypothetical protein